MIIENVSRKNIQEGLHIRADNAYLIQISDIMQGQPVPAVKFQKVLQLEFMDCDDPEISIQSEQADQIVELLREAYYNNKDVVVHCVAGLCRSGAVVEAGIMLGFTPGARARTPNSYVVRKLFDSIGITINAQTSAFN